MSQLVFGSAINYTAADVLPFVTSLRKHYDGKTVLLTSQTPDASLANLCIKFGIDFFHIPEDLNPIGRIVYKRFSFYKDFSSGPLFAGIDRFFLTDVRDVVFQRSPFSLPLHTDLEFFLEPAEFDECPVNKTWIAERYGWGVARQFRKKKIICAGTIRCTLSGLHNVCTKISSTAEHFLARGIWPNDQAILNHLVYTDQLFNFRILETGEGTVSTMHHQTHMLFNQNGELCNRDGSVTPVVHQWDRTGPLARVFQQMAETLL